MPHVTVPQSHIELPAVDPTLVASSAQVIEGLIERSKRDAIPIRNDFVQRRAGKDSKSQPGPLSQLVKHRDKRALVLYLLVRTLASTSPWDASLPAATWARALDLNGDSKSARSAVSKAIGRLRDLGLIETTRRGRRSEITVLHESGNGKAYFHPGGSEGFYFKLPHEFFTQRWHERLDLPAIAMLLVLLHRPPGEPLPVRKVETWYGISAATAERGLQQLREHNLVTSNWVQKPDPLDARGYRFDMHHRLITPFYKKDPQSLPTPTSKPKARRVRRGARKPVTT